jgi:hypothetical protein
MASRVHSLETMASHVSRAPASSSVKTASVTDAAPSQPQNTETPSFTAVFAQIAAAAAAAGTTVASIAPAGATPAQSDVVTPKVTAVTTTSTGATTETDTTTETGADGPAGPLFGANPWLSDPTGHGPNGTVTHYNPVYFATEQTAETVAQMVGGTVTQSVQITTAPGSPFQQDESNYMVQLPGGGQLNPGFIADLYTHGWNQAFIDQQIAAEVAGAQSAVSS